MHHKHPATHGYTKDHTLAHTHITQENGSEEAQGDSPVCAECACMRAYEFTPTFQQLYYSVLILCMWERGNI